MIPMTTLEKMIKYRTDQYDFSDDGIWENELILMALKELRMYRTGAKVGRAEELEDDLVKITC